MASVERYGKMTGRALGEALGALIYWLWFERPPRTKGGTVSSPKVTYEGWEDDEDQWPER